MTTLERTQIPTKWYKMTNSLLRLRGTTWLSRETLGAITSLREGSSPTWWTNLFQSKALSQEWAWSSLWSKHLFTTVKLPERARSKPITTTQTSQRWVMKKTKLSAMTHSRQRMQMTTHFQQSMDSASTKIPRQSPSKKCQSVRHQASFLVQSMLSCRMTSSISWNQVTESKWPVFTGPSLIWLVVWPEAPLRHRSLQLESKVFLLKKKSQTCPSMMSKT